MLGVRPEHLALGRGDRPGWPMRVEALEMLGAERLVYGSVGGSLLTLRLDATVPPPKAGETIALDAPADHLHWFDATTHQRLRAADVALTA